MTTRRDLLKTLGALAAAGCLPGLALARGPETDRRLVVLFLRGGLDGLSAVPAHGDPAFDRVRGPLGVLPPGTEGGALRLDATFGLHPVLGTMHRLYAEGELAVLHAAATPYRNRSHFDAQNLLENGTARAHGRDSGWLNAALAEVSAGEQGGLALGPSVPLLLRGPAPVGSWSPSRMPAPEPGLLERLEALYLDDPLLAPAFAAGRSAHALMDHAGGMGGAAQGGPLRVRVRAAAKFLVQPRGPRVATIDSGGWDTHANQDSPNGPLTRGLRQLDAALGELKSALGPAWQHTVVLVVTEFGRTVAMNGSRGTDHGTGAAAFVLGGAVRGGRVIADWPGLSAGDLHEGRDLRPTTDLRALFKAALIAQLGIGEGALESRVFPESRPVRPLEGLFA